MTREQQTAWIVGAIVVVGLAILYVITRDDPSSPYAQCQMIIGHDHACEADIAAKRLLGY
jgi:hypothetical protein